MPGASAATGCCFPPLTVLWVPGDSPQTQLRPQHSGDSLGTACPILGWRHPRTGSRMVLTGVLEHPKTPLNQHPVLGLRVPISSGLAR